MGIVRVSNEVCLRLHLQKSGSFNYCQREVLVWREREERRYRIRSIQGNKLNQHLVRLLNERIRGLWRGSKRNSRREMRSPLDGKGRVSEGRIGLELLWAS